MKLKPLDQTYRTKVWDAMNELESVTAKICSARDICDTVAELIAKQDYNKAESLANAAYEFLGYFLQDFDVRFKNAWKTTLDVADVADNSVSIQDQKYEAQYLANDLLTQDRNSNFPADLMPPWGHSDMEALKYTEEELNAMCDAAEAKTWTSPIEVDGPSGEWYITFPDELIEKVGWGENDTLEWINNNDGTFSIKKVEK